MAEKNTARGVFEHRGFGAYPEVVYRFETIYSHRQGHWDKKLDTRPAIRAIQEAKLIYLEIYGIDYDTDREKEKVRIEEKERERQGRQKRDFILRCFKLSILAMALSALIVSLILVINKM